MVTCWFVVWFVLCFVRLRFAAGCLFGGLCVCRLVVLVFVILISVAWFRFVVCCFVLVSGFILL